MDMHFSVRKNYKTMQSIIFCVQLATLIAFVYGNKNTDEKSSQEILKTFSGEVNKEMEFWEECAKVNLVIEPYCSTNTSLVVGMEFSDEKFKGCFTHLDVFLNKNKIEVSKAKVTINDETKMDAFHVFENVTRGTYDIHVTPCYNSWQCQKLSINYFSYNMTGSCHGVPAVSDSLFSRKATNAETFLIGAIVSILLVLIIVGIAFVRFKFANQQYRRQRTAAIQNGMRIRVYILNHYDEGTLQKVQVIKDFLAQFPEIIVTDIGEELYLQQIELDEWLNDMLGTSESADVIKKFIVINHAKKTEDLVNENENKTFWEAVRKIRKNYANRQKDYENVFKVYFGDDSKIKELEDIVPKVQYLIRKTRHMHRLYDSILYGYERTLLPCLPF